MRNTMAPFLLGKEGDGAIVVSFGPEASTLECERAGQRVFSHRVFQGEVAIRETSAPRRSACDTTREC